MDANTPKPDIFLRAYLNYYGAEIPLWKIYEFSITPNPWAGGELYTLFVWNEEDEDAIWPCCSYTNKEAAEAQLANLRTLYDEARARYLRAMEKLFGEANDEQI